MGNNRLSQCRNVTADINEGGIVCHAPNGQINVVYQTKKLELSAGMNVAPNAR